MEPVKRIIVNTSELLYARAATLRCGAVHSGDIVWLKSGVVGEVVSFWSNASEDCIVVRILAFRAIDADHDLWDVSAPIEQVADSAHILDGVMWIQRSAHQIQLIAPFRARFAGLLARSR